MITERIIVFIIIPFESMQVKFPYIHIYEWNDDLDAGDRMFFLLDWADIELLSLPCPACLLACLLALILDHRKREYLVRTLDKVLAGNFANRSLLRVAQNNSKLLNTIRFKHLL
ncbi:hypothetical protein FQ179_10120 [Pusillimonas sp. ANT_WB101]|nr:hypothetical protein FQ179_10120 [Pusillimonas sp. ANT_WB101]